MKCCSCTVLLALLFLFAGELKAQDVKAPATQAISVSTLQYQPEMPPVNSYKVMKNTSTQDIPDSVLLQINAKRMANENVEWKVSDEIEIIIYPINAQRFKEN